MFTKFEEDVSVHQSLADEPNIDNGLSAEELKKLWDKPAEKLKKAFNDLVDELSYDIAANSLGASALSEGDTTASTVQAKLEYLYKVIQDVALGTIPDGTITKVKIDPEYTEKIAEKDGMLQENLNAELLNGIELSEILDIDNKYLAGTYKGHGEDEPITITLGFKPKFIIIIDNMDGSTHVTCKGLGGGASIQDTGFKVTSKYLLLSSITYSYVAFK